MNSMNSLDSLQEKFFIYLKYSFMSLELIESDMNFINNLDSYEISLIRTNLSFYEDYFSNTFPYVYRQFEEGIIFFLRNNELIIENKEKLTDFIYKLLLGMFTTLKSVVDYWQRLLPPEKIPLPMLNALLRSFGLYKEFFESLPIILLRKLLAILVKSYKIKGTKSAVDLFIKNMIFGNMEIIELFAEKRSKVPISYPIFYGYTSDGIRLEITDVADERWWVSSQGFETANV